MNFKILLVGAIIKLLLLSINTCSAQRYDVNWAFGDSIGFHFSNEGRLSFFQTNTSLKKTGSYETQASISNLRGNLIAYLAPQDFPIDTLKFRLYDNSNIPIKNSDNILVHSIFANGAVFIPDMRDSTKYYLLTIDYRKVNPRLLCKIGCSIYIHTLKKVDASYTITDKNILLYEGELSDKLAVVAHANGYDWWIIAHESISNRFIKFLLCNEKVLGPIFQNIGRGPTTDNLISQNYYWKGEMIFSPLGNKLAVAAGNIQLLELLDFDRCTGMLSNVLSLGYSNLSNEKPKYEFFGVSISPDESKLYASLREWDSFGITFKSSIIQYDLNSGPNYDKIIIGEINSQMYDEFSYHELSVNNKIYITKDIKTNDTSRYCLAIINEPNLKYPACKFDLNGICVKKGLPTSGLPTFPVFRVQTLPIPAARIAITLPDCPEYERVIGQEDGRTYLWEDGSSEPLRLIPFSTQPQKYIRWAYNLYDPECAVRCDTFIVNFKRTHFIFSTGEKRSLCNGDSLKIGSLVNKCDTCYYRWLPTQGLKDPNGLQTTAKPVKNTSYIRSTYLRNGCLVGSDTVHITIIEKDVPPCTTVSRSEMVGKTTFTFFPNPANQEVSIFYAVPIEECATMEAFTATGARIAEWKLKGGRGQLTLDTKAWSEGVYLFRFNCNGQIYTHKLMISR